MNNTSIFNKTTLGFALAVQVVLIGALLAARSGAVTEPAPFLRFEAASIDALTVSNDEGSVSLAKTDDAWQLPQGLPADSSKIDRVLDKLADASGGWPVGSKGSTAERFEVAEDNHQRRVTLKSGDEIQADFYLGTSPGYRKAHARHADEDDIYAITFSNYEAGVEAADWLDKSLLRPEGALTGVERIDGFALTKGDDGVWAAADNTELDQGKAETFAGRFTGLSVLGVSDAELPDEPKMAFALTDDAGTETLRIYHLEADDDYVATSGRVPGAYELSSYIAEQMDKAIGDLAPEADASEEADVAEEADASEETDVAEDEPSVEDDLDIETEPEPESP